MRPGLSRANFWVGEADYYSEVQGLPKIKPVREMCELMIDPAGHNFRHEVLALG